MMRDTVSYAQKTMLEHRKGAASDALPPDDRLPKQLAYGAIKYSIFKCSYVKNVIFDREDALNFQGDTSVYLQYTFVRIHSLARGECCDLSEEEVTMHTHPLQWEITKKILSFGRFCIPLQRISTSHPLQLFI